MEGGDGAVVREAVLAADDAYAEDVPLLVQDLQPLGAALRRQSGDDPNLPEGPHVAVSDDDVAALHEVLVNLRLVEAADHRPDGRDWGDHLLHHGGAALVRADGVGVVSGHNLRDRWGGAVCYRSPGWRVLGLLLACHVDVVGGGGGDGGVVDSVELKRGFWWSRDHFP